MSMVRNRGGRDIGAVSLLSPDNRTEVDETQASGGVGMACINFVGPYKPIMCGIGDYTEYVTRQLPPESWAVLSFDPQTYGSPVTSNNVAATDPVLYGIPGDNRFSASVVEDGLRKLWYEPNSSVLWFQHEFGIWPDDHKFISMLENLKLPKVVTLHTLHFQSLETPSGLRRWEYEFLRDMLPHVEGITVFSRGVYNAVTSAFPEHRAKVYVLRHGIHSYPDVTRMTHREAKEQLNDFLLYESDLRQEMKENLHKERVLLDESIVVIGQTGFLAPAKGSELLYVVGDKLRQALPSKRIAAVRIGNPRDDIQKDYAEQLERETDQINDFILVLSTLLPRDMLPVAQRAFDINFYWPSDCTQSGIMAHALGAGATIAGRDMEGVGETFKEAGAITTTDMDQLVADMQQLILYPELADMAEYNALKYATDYSWENQALRHRALAHLAGGFTPSYAETSAHAEWLEIASETSLEHALA